MKRQIVRKLIKILLAILAFYLFILLIVFIVFMVKKDQIAEALLLSMNKEINGEVEFADISLHPFIHFPNISLVLKDFEFYENPDSARTILDDPIAQFENVYFVFDVLDLIKNRITVTKVRFENGYLDVIRYPSRKYNFEIAIGKAKPNVKKKTGVKKKTVVKRDSTIIEKKKVTPKKSLLNKTLVLKLDRVKLIDVHVEYNNQLNGRQSYLFFRDMIASLSISPDSIYTSLYSKTEIQKLEFSNSMKIRNIDCEFQSSFTFDRNDSVINFKPSILIINRASFGLKGIMDFRGDGLVDIGVSGSDKKLGFLSMLLTKSGIENLKTGSLFFEGKLRGTFKEEIPNLFIDFGIRDLSLKIPSTNDSIKNLNINGYFSSGNLEDLSQASLVIDTMSAILPDGFIDGSFQLKNFTEPRIKYKVTLKTQLEGLERTFKLNFLDNLKGKIEINDEFDGIFFPGKGWHDYKGGNLNIGLDSISFRIPGNLNIENLNGTITDKNDRIRLKKLKIKTGKSDLAIDGNIRNFSNLFFDEGKKLTGNFSVSSKMFDFNEIFSTDSSSNVSAVRLSNVKFNIDASASRDNLLEFTRVPQISFSVNNLKANIDSLLKPLTIKKGQIVLTEDNNVLKLYLRKFEVKIANTELLASGSYYQRNSDPPRIRTSLKAKKMNFGKMFLKGIVDTSVNMLNTPISGSMNIDIHLSDKRNESIKTINFKADSLIYAGKKNRFRIRGLTMTAKGISYDTSLSYNPFASLSAKVQLSAKRVRTRNYILKDISYSIDVNKGVYTIVPDSDAWFGAKATGKYIISPFKNPPFYSVDYSVKQFPVGKLFVMLLKDSVLAGKMNLNLRLSCRGESKDSITKSLKGKLRIQGTNLKLYGINVDDFLKKLKINQGFDLFDIGLVVSSGPLGLFAKRGNRFASVVVTEREKFTKITGLVSDWRIKSDSIIVDDVAFTTTQNRLAMKGWYKYNSDSLDFKMAWIDSKGCSIFSQHLAGAAGRPRIEGFGLFTTLEVPVNNPVGKKGLLECKPFYKGSLIHPKKIEIP